MTGIPDWNGFIDKQRFVNGGPLADEGDGEAAGCD